LFKEQQSTNRDDQTAEEIKGYYIIINTRTCFPFLIIGIVLVFSRSARISLICGSPTCFHNEEQRVEVRIMNR